LVPIYFFQRFLHLFRSSLNMPEFPPLAPEIPGELDIPSFGPEFPPLAGISAPLAGISAPSDEINTT
jgi:hypothetical protein